MRVFQKVIDEGGFAAAARVLDMAPAGVTRLVTDLEQHLGTRLIQRTTRKLALTEAGQAYLMRVRGILSEVDDAEAAASQDASELQGVVNIVAPPLFANYFLAPQITHWLARHPKVAIHLHADPFPQTRVEEFDVAFMVVNEGFDANIVARPLAQTEYVICASPAYLKRMGTPKLPEDLSQHHYLRFPWQASSGHAACACHDWTAARAISKSACRWCFRLKATIPCLQRQWPELALRRCPGFRPAITLKVAR